MIEVGVARTPAAVGGVALLVAMMALLSSCAEVEVGAEALKSLSRSSTSASADVETSNVDNRFATSPGSPINPGLEPDPEEFETAGFAVWDGARTLQGIWVAHPKAREARRVRVINSETGRAVDGALFRRDTRIGGPPILISSEAAAALSLEPDVTTKLLIVALKPSSRQQPQIASAAPETTGSADVGSTTEIEETTLTEIDTADSNDGDRVAAAAGTAAATDAMVEEITSESSGEVSTEVSDQTGAVALNDNDSAQNGAKESDNPAQELIEPASIDPEVPVVEATAVIDESPAIEAPNSTQIVAPAEPGVATDVKTALAPEEPKAEPELKWEAPPTETVETTPETNETPQVKSEMPDTEAVKSSGLVIKAGVFGVKENADRLVEKIQNAGFPATGETFSSGSRTLTSVVAGPFDSPEQQAAALHVIRGLGVPDAIATKG